LGQFRRWIGVSGNNIPSFELFVSPDWRGVEGVYFADQPSYKNGNYVRGIRLEFKRGSVSLATAQEGERFLKALVATDAGAGRLGEFSLTDRRFSRINRFMADTLFDENYGGKHGNCHIALGFSYIDTYSGELSSMNKKEKTSLGFNESAIHWDLVNTEPKRVTARLTDGSSRVIYENGEFQTTI
jgi:aminopeptidase